MLKSLFSNNIFYKKTSLIERLKRSSNTEQDLIELFNSPIDKILPILDEHVVEFLKVSTTKFQLLSNLLSNKLLLPSIDKHIIELYSEAGEHKLYIINQLFSNKDFFPLIDGHIFELLRESDKLQKMSIMNQLFSNKDFLPLIGQNIIELYQNSSKECKLLITDQLFNNKYLLPLIEQYIVELYKDSPEGNKIQIVGHLNNQIEKRGIDFSEKLIDAIAREATNEHDLAILKFTPCLLTLKPSGLNSLVQNLLAKTYATTNICGITNKQQFVKIFSDELSFLIEKSPSLAKLLEQAIKGDSYFFITSKENIGNVEIWEGNNAPPAVRMTGTCGKDNIIAIYAPSSIKELVSAIIHESTHKVINMLYKNNSLPYGKDNSDSFIPVRSAIASELINTKELEVYLSRVITIRDISTDSWLASMLRKYSSEKHDIELFPWFAQHIADTILDSTSHESSLKVSEQFSQFMWRALQDILITPIRQEDEESISIEDMPSNLGREVTVPLDKKETISKAVAFIEANAPISMELLSSDIWKNAVNVSRKYNENFYKNLFSLNSDQLGTLLKIHAGTLLQHADSPNNFIDKLFAIKPDILLSVLEDNIIDLLESTNKRGNIAKFIEPLFKLDQDWLSNVLEKNTGKIFDVLKSKYIQSLFILKLFEQNQLSSVLQKYSGEILKIVNDNLDDYSSNVKEWAENTGNCAVVADSRESEAYEHKGEEVITEKIVIGAHSLLTFGDMDI